MALENEGNGLAEGQPRVYPKRPDIGIRNIMKSELGRMPSKQEVKARMKQMGFPESSLRGRKVKVKSAVKRTAAPKDLITLLKGSRLIGVHVSSLYNWVRAKKLKGIRVKDNSSKGFHYEVDKSTILALKRHFPKKKQVSASPGATAAKTYRQKKKEAQKIEPQPVETNGFATHVSYAAGHVASWLSDYAAEVEIPRRVMMGAVGDLLKKGGE